ncbi:leucine-rich repeat-containing protein 57-like [Ochlerotatus camptorhynchus]|uniref:leucine-rich repeat-containing protein 57-like n=1 Tax=Ochlerotatus camptorhynchus TaxID=644619 RepID=UPI0031D8725D
MNCGVLHWSYRDFRQMPEELRTCSDQVVEVYLKENFIPSVPAWFCEEMTRLKFVCLAGNMITEVPEQISLLQNLESLNLSQNLVEALPKTIGKLRNLCCLKLGENKLTRMPKEIGTLENLEVLDLSKNRLTEVPTELANCTKLKDLILDDNYLLCRIPTKLFAMPQLMFISAERCNLVLLPFILNTTTLEGVKVFNNYTLTHYPMVLEKFMQPSYDLFTAIKPRKISKAYFYQRVSCDAIPHNLIFPIELTTILDRRKSTHTPCSLVEMCMRRCNLAKMFDTKRSDNCLPQSLSRRLQNGPLAVCGSVPCSMDVFGECFLGLVKR